MSRGPAMRTAALSALLIGLLSVTFDAAAQPPAPPPVAMNAKDADPEIVRRSDLALKIIEKIPTRQIAVAAARLLTTHKEDGTTEVLLNYLPLSEDESVGDEIRTTLAALAVRDGKPDK